MLVWNARYRRFDSRPWARTSLDVRLISLAGIYRCSRGDAQRLAYREAVR